MISAATKRRSGEEREKEGECVVSVSRSSPIKTKVV